MSQNGEEIRQRMEEMERRYQESERRQEEERRLREEAERREEEERRLREAAEQQLRDTTLPEFLNACHEHLFLGLAVQPDKTSSTKGSPANADHKLRPSRIQEWTTFADEQMAIWEDLMGADFVTERHFTSLSGLEGAGRGVRERMLSSELDLGYFLRQTVESHVSSVIKQLHANPQLRRIFHLHGDVTFENHANTLTDESEIVTNMGSLSLAQDMPRRSERLAARRSRETSSSTSRPEMIQTSAQPLPSLPRPRADQFCVYNRGLEEKVPAFIIEYTAPHKLSLAHIQAGLQDMELDPVVRYQKGESPEDKCRRVVAAVITQSVDYMVRGGNEYGYVSTGEAFIFLRMLQDDPSTVLYYLSVPKEDVGDTTGWTGNVNDDNRLHLTSLGQVLAFTLRALRTPPRPLNWRYWAMAQLETWEMVYDLVLDEISENDIPSSIYKPPRSRIEYCSRSPVKTRSKSMMAVSCQLLTGSTVSNYDDDDDDSGVSTRSQQTASKGKTQRYCTQQCLRGLCQRGPLDKNCPNAQQHGVDRHQLSRATLLKLLHRQLSDDDPRPDSELGCESLHVHGSRGALFKVTLLSHGYTFVGKGVPANFISYSRHEESMYSHLTTIQGLFVPVILGSLDLHRPISYDGIAEMVRLTLMSYAGRTLVHQHGVDWTQIVPQAEKSLRAIHELGILHSDVTILGNIIWNEENNQVMFIDFERAQYQKRRPAGTIPANKKRKRVFSIWDKSPNKQTNRFERETSRMISALRF
ncbi:uncharacterized protein TRUGW13939_03842 [Talaromyces rugulosus]|uniref:Protein kinase domain-containing protein n=1 Tax=Talaromyces rugulosus TaxID=121627 RepID=A0A7H8QSB2_TALRU|nr:uncharacterized protein TRUGW13939_03842 [Talaromyces rugulosus]QKX56736.1 hypothetical protein TRUGW13939_03842 [Talaromyces rugulosus]